MDATAWFAEARSARGALEPLSRLRERGREEGPRMPSRHTLEGRAKAMRSGPTDAEQKLWFFLRAHRFQGLKFKRQVPIAGYIVDFVCFERGLIVELDGGQHTEQARYDEKREQILSSHGFRILRFWNNDFLNNRDAVLEKIRIAASQPWTLSPSPSPASGRGED